ncbi:MAG: rRNA maturation RNase YbeY [Spirochaetales bacterium]|nr:rRNA maturation RNase YbeY [Spirochaetales bacterium]
MKNRIDISFDDEAARLKKLFLTKKQVTEWANAVAAKLDLHDFEMSVYFCSDEEIRSLNRDYRSLDEVTDVLSFSQIEGEDVGFPTGKRKQLGDIVISLAQTLRQAAEDGHDPIAEEKMLILPGMLHLRGYDHVTDNGEMMELHKKILDMFS